MAAVVSPSPSSPATPSPAAATNPSFMPSLLPSSNPNHPILPPLITSTPARQANLPRPMSHASKNRLSQYSTGSIAPRSRPASHVFPIFTSSLSYTLVRDFAYPNSHPLHYGPPPEPSRPQSDLFTPSLDSQSQQRFSDPPSFWDYNSGWEASSGSNNFYRGANDIPPILLADGPPWSEDEDLQSPVVSSRHRKHKSTSSAFGHNRSHSSRDEFGEGGRMAAAQASACGNQSYNHGHAIDGGGSDPVLLNPDRYDRDRGYYVGTGGDGSERYYVDQEGDEANGPGGEFVTYPPDQAQHSTSLYQLHRQSNYGGYRPTSDVSSPDSSPDYREDDQSRYSRDYQFTITSPDEEMHGKAVALFDFARENENELPLVEGQIIWVSYRHGQGWLVAMDPKTQESGLVPEEYVRLLRDIEGGMTSLTGQAVAAGDGAASPNDDGTPTLTQAENQLGLQGFAAGHAPTPSTVSNGYHQPIVSTFSTSSKDLDPYPQHLLGTQVGQTPPQVIHYHGQRGGSQANTPTLLGNHDAGTLRRGSQDTTARKSESHVSLILGPLLDDSTKGTLKTNAEAIAIRGATPSDAGTNHIPSEKTAAV
ncbi:HOG (high osmolarity glycerol) pathway protein [Sporothrix epigloea]|uniref:HOG (High osmolarity glycerol) pathway protein n=1 Tax=Sporothrix epigloea TaxID=1892477 RepID=A0ABP0D352_9PEZI